MSSVTLSKFNRVFRDRGVGGLASSGLRQAVGAVEAYRALGKRPEFDDLTALRKFGNETGRGFFQAFQVQEELARLLEMVDAAKPRCVLEIGTANGGTLFFWTRVATPDATLISIDLPAGDFGEGYAQWRIPIYRRFPLPGQTLHLIRGDSHAPETRDRAQVLLDGDKVDFLFIDGDHTYDGVRADFELFAPLVRPGGLIALHDVVVHRDTTCQVHRLWEQLQQAHRTTDLTSDPDQGWAGIGVVHVDEPIAGPLPAKPAPAEPPKPAR